MHPGLNEILFISTALFFIGVYGFFTRRNLVTMLMSIELILNSVNLNFIAFNKYLWPHKLDGLFFTIFIIAVIPNWTRFLYIFLIGPTFFLAYCRAISSNRTTITVYLFISLKFYIYVYILFWIFLLFFWV